MICAEFTAEFVWLRTKRLRTSVVMYSLKKLIFYISIIWFIMCSFLCLLFSLYQPDMSCRTLNPGWCIHTANPAFHLFFFLVHVKQQTLQYFLGLWSCLWRLHSHRELGGIWRPPSNSGSCLIHFKSLLIYYVLLQARQFFQVASVVCKNNEYPKSIIRFFFIPFQVKRWPPFFRYS